METINSVMTLISMNDDNSLRSEDGKDERLLPGLPDEIILDHVVPKLPWRTFHILSSVSCRWREGIQSRHVYDARVRSHSTEKLLVLKHSTHEGGDHMFSLYSVRDDSWHQLPQFPKSWQKRIAIHCKCISLDGKLYVLGGVATWGDYGSDHSGEVYALDLAGQREWRQCAELSRTTAPFGYGVLNGKIYALGGMTRSDNHVSMVYDPKANVWSSIRPMKYLRMYSDVVGVGEELFVYAGRAYDPDPSSVIAEVYHAGKDEWRLLEPFTCHESAQLFSAQGNLYMASPFAIYRDDIDIDGNYSWTRLHSLSFGEDHDPGDDSAMTHAEVVNTELFGVILVYDPYREEHLRTSLCQSIGFGSKQKEIVWDKIESPFLNDRPHDFSISTIEL